MQSWLESLDPGARTGILIGLAVVLPLVSVVLNGLLGLVMGYVRVEPKLGRVVTLLLVGTLVLAAIIGGAAVWVYMYYQHGWFPGGWKWFWAFIWFANLIGSYVVPGRKKFQKNTQPASA